MHELKRDEPVKERFQYFRGNYFPEETNFGSKHLRKDKIEVVKFKACRQLPKALQPKPPGSVPTISNGRAFSQPASPVMKRQNVFPFRNQPPILDNSKLKQVSWNTRADIRSTGSLTQQNFNSNDKNRYSTIPREDRYNSKLYGASYTSGRVIKESLCPLLREALRKDDNDSVLESILQNRNNKKINEKAHSIQTPLNSIKSPLSDKGNDVKSFTKQSYNGSSEFLTSGVFFTVKLMKAERKGMGFTLGTSIFDDKEVIVINKIMKGSEAMNFLQEGDEVLSINGVTNLNLPDILKYVEQFKQEILCLELHRRF